MVIRTRKPLLILSTLFSFSSNVASTTKLAVWNCALENSNTYSEFSLMNVQDCSNISSDYRLAHQLNGQIVQAVNYLDISVTKCTFIADYFTSYCSYSLLTGYRQWNSENVASKIQMKLTKTECSNALKNKILRYQDRHYYGKNDILTIQLSPASTADGWLTLRGSTSGNTGTCIPDTFFVNNVFFPSHVLTMKYEIKIELQHGIFNTARKIIKIADIVLPNVPSGSFYSFQFGNYYWTPLPEGNLTYECWREIADGFLDIYASGSSKHSLIGVFESAYTNQSLAVALSQKTSLCIGNACRNAYKLTMIRDTYIITYNLTGQSRISLDTVSGSNVNKMNNLHLSVASVFLDQEVRLRSTFETVARELCQNNRNTILSNIKTYINNIILPMSQISNDARFFVRSGSVLYAIKCIQTEAVLRTERFCFDKVPVTFIKDNRSVNSFLDPLTYVLTPTAIRIPCSDILLQKFNLMKSDGSTFWLCRSSVGWHQECAPPEEISPLQPSALFMPSDRTLNPSLYSGEQLNALNELQWHKNLKEETVDEWNEFLQNNIKKENKPKRIFLHEFFNSIVNPLGKQFLYSIVLRHIWPIIAIHCLVTSFVSVARIIKNIRKHYYKEGLTSSFLLKLPSVVFFSLVPCVPGPQELNQICECPCKDADFAAQISRGVETIERQRFLQNLL